MITVIYNVDQNDDHVTVQAVVEDVVLTYAATHLDPPEYGPALCEASFYLGEDETLPTNDDDLIEFLEKLDLEWEVLPMDDY